MRSKQILELMLIGLCFHNFRQTNAQYTDRPTGVAGVVQGIVQTATDIMENAFETAAESTDLMERLLKSTLYSLVNNPATKLTAGLRNRNLGTSMIMLRNVYVDSLELVSETIHQRMEHMSEVREHIQRAENILEVPARELQHNTRCLNTQMATDVTNELFLCSTPTIHAIITELRQMHEDVQKVFENLGSFLQRRRLCLRRPPRDSVPCFQSLINEAPEFLQTIHESFSVPQPMYEQMQMVNECSSRLRNMVKVLCPNNYETM